MLYLFYISTIRNYKGVDNILLSRRRHVVRIKAAALPVAEPEIIPRLTVIDERSLSWIRAAAIRDMVVSNEVTRFGCAAVVGFLHVRVQRDLPDAGPVAAKGEVGVSIVGDDDVRVDGVGAIEGRNIGAVAFAGLDDSPVVNPQTTLGKDGGSHADCAVANAGIADRVVAVEHAFVVDDRWCPGTFAVSLVNLAALV